MKRILAICDSEEEYVRKLMRYLNECGQIPFEVQAYTSLELFLKAAQEKPPAILLIAIGLLEPVIKELGIEKIVLLSQGEPVGEFGEYPSIAKYQAASGIVREVMQYYMGAMQAVATMVGVKQCQIWGIYSPVKGCGKTSLSLALSSLCGNRRRTLYLNLEGQSGFSRLFQEESVADITDAVYYFRQQRETGMERILSMIRQMDSFFYIPPALYEEDIKSVEGQEWEVFLRLMAEKSGYEEIILDVGDAVQGVGRILNLCNEVFMPVKEDILSQAKLSEGMEALTTSGFGMVKERILQVRPMWTEKTEGKDIWKIIKNEEYLRWVQGIMEQVG